MLRKYKLPVFVIGSIFAIAASGSAAPGDLDRTFSHDGRLVANGSYYATADRVQPDGKIVVGYAREAGLYAVVVINRFNTDGTLDPTFGNAGEVVTPLTFDTSNNNGYDIAIQPDGKIVAALFGDFDPSGIVRYNANGSLDTTFGNGGIAPGGSAYGVSLTIQPDGKILLTTEFFLIRLNANGSIDTTFGGGDGIQPLPAGTYGRRSAIQADGKIVTASHPGALIRHTVNGTLDAEFGHGGIVTTPPGFDLYSVLIQTDGKILAAGKWGSVFAVLRCMMDGSPDATFGGGDGIVTTSLSDGSDAATALGVQPDGKILAAGYSGYNTNFALVRYDPYGTLDTTFGGGTGFTTADFNDSYDVAGGLVLDDSSRAYLVGSAGVRPAIACFVLDDRHYPVDLDFDGDGPSDISVFRPSEATWYLDRSTDGFYAAQFGLSMDRITPADFDGDGKTDIAVYRPSSGTWYWLNSSDGSLHGLQFGTSEDLPTPFDYDGDSRADVSVFRPSIGTWYRQNSSDGSFFAMQFGAAGDKPAVGNYDGDARADIAVFRPSSGTWYWVNSSDGSIGGEQFGTGDDVIAPGDYDGDGRTDLAVFRPSNGYWYIHNSFDSVYTAFNFGLIDDIPAPGDFDGDGRTDIAVFRPSDGNWYRVSSQNRSFIADHFGTAEDTPIQGAFRY